MARHSLDVLRDAVCGVVSSRSVRLQGRRVLRPARVLREFPLFLLSAFLFYLYLQSDSISF